MSIKDEMRQLISDLEKAIQDYDKGRSRSQHVGRLTIIMRNMRKELDRMPDFDISINIDREYINSNQFYEDAEEVEVETGTIPSGALRRYEPSPSIQKMLDQENKKWYKERMGMTI